MIAANTKNKLLKNLFAIIHGDMTHGTDRIEKILDFLGNPHKSYPIIHVAGTNGKGSVCSLIASILQESGYKVGLYTSPHIVYFNERIRVNSEYITDKEIEENFLSINDLAFAINASFFEITSAIAFNHFSKHKVDVAVIETGLGGKYDSTNVVEPILSIITPIDLDHTHLLGDSIQKIAQEKAGIIKKVCPVLVQDFAPHIIEILQKKATKQNTQLFFGYDFPNIHINSFTKNLQMNVIVRLPNSIDAFFDFDDWQPMNDLSSLIEYNIVNKLCGIQQINNIKTAVFASMLLANSFKFTHRTILSGIENVKKNTGLRYRIECVRESPYIVLDVSHNPHSILELVTTLKLASQIDKWHFIFGVMHDKNIKQMLEYIQPICSRLTVVTPQINRAAKPATIKRIAKELNFKTVKIAKSCSEVISKIDETSEPTVICGSFYVIEDVVKALKLEEYNENNDY